MGNLPLVMQTQSLGAQTQPILCQTQRLGRQTQSPGVRTQPLLSRPQSLGLRPQRLLFHPQRLGLHPQPLGFGQKSSDLHPLFIKNRLISPKTSVPAAQSRPFAPVFGIYPGSREKSGGGPPQSKTLARTPSHPNRASASWSAPVLWRFGPGDFPKRRGFFFQGEDVTTSLPSVFSIR